MSGIMLALLGSVIPLRAVIQAGEARSSTTADFNFNTNTVTISGGTPPYTQAWTWSGVSGGGGAAATFAAGNTATTVTPRVTGVVVGPAITGNLTCTVTDALSAVAASPASAYEYERV